MTTVEPAPQRPRAAIAGLVICWVVGCVMTPVVTFVIFILWSAGSWRPTIVDQIAGFVIVTAGSYAIGGLVGSLAILRSPDHSRRVYRTGVGITCLSAAATGFAVAAIPQLSDANGLLIVAVAPIPVAAAGMVVMVLGRRVWAHKHEGIDALRHVSPRAWEAATVWVARAATGRPHLAWASLGVFAAGYAFMLDSSGAEGVLVAMITSAVSLFLALRALPNVLAILAVIVSSLLLLVLMFGGRFLHRPV